MSIQPLNAGESEMYMMWYAGPILNIQEHRLDAGRRENRGKP
jgi:hypothetical protein